MIGFGIILIVLAILNIEIFVYDKDLSNNIIRIGSSVLLVLVAIIFIVDNNRFVGPTAMDVYRGKTELQINQKVINGEIIESDTTVIWKH